MLCTVSVEKQSLQAAVVERCTRLFCMFLYTLALLATWPAPLQLSFPCRAHSAAHSHGSQCESDRSGLHGHPSFYSVCHVPMLTVNNFRADKCETYCIWWRKSFQLYCNWCALWAWKGDDLAAPKRLARYQPSLHRINHRRPRNSASWLDFCSTCCGIMHV